MTDRILPAISLPTPDGTALPVGVATPVRRTAVVRHQEKFFTTPARASILLATSAAVYAVSLAAVAGLQASDDAAIAARRQPFLDAIASSRAANDALEAAVSDVDVDARTLADSYTGVADQLAAYELQLDELATLVAAAQGSMAALPDRIGLPAVSIRGPINSAGGATTSRGSGGHANPPPKPATVTRASGG